MSVFSGKSPTAYALISAFKLDLRRTYASAHVCLHNSPDLILIVFLVIIEPTSSSVSSCTVILNFKFGAFNVVWFIDFLTGHNGFYALRTAKLCSMRGNCLNRDICGIRLFESQNEHSDPLNLQIVVTSDNPIGFPCKSWIVSRASNFVSSAWFSEQRRKIVFESFPLHIPITEVSVPRNHEL
jgi:hypothetical protein